MQTISNDGLTRIKNSEGFRANAYNATGFEPYLTIGYGHYGPDVRSGQVVTEAEATAMLLNDMESYIQAVRNYTQEKANQNQFDALVSFCYNLGVGIFNGWGNFDADYVRRNLPLYNKGFGPNGNLIVLDGLNNRRREELALFNKPYNGQPVEKEKPKEKGEVEKMILFTVTDKGYKNDKAQYLFNGVQLTRLDGTSSELLKPSTIQRDINGAQLRSLVGIGIKVVGAY